jgi:mono/diheme cytochrome c family protein
MTRRIILLILAVLLPLAALAQSPPPAAEEGQAAAKSYVPGIEQFMNVIQNEHAKLWYAGSAQNWELAAYQLGEIKEIMSDVEDLYPTFKNLPLGKMLDAVITGQIVEVEKALDAKDSKAFAAGYDKLTEACNSCHQATGNGFIVIQRPSGPAFPNQNFAPRK